jgi:hypothetical protein
MSAQPENPINGQIILLKGQSQYGVLRIFIDELNEGFEKLGYRSTIIDLNASDATQQLELALSQPVFFVIGMNGVGIDLKIDGHSLYDTYGIPYFAFLVDHPIHHLIRLKTPVNNLIVSCIDQSHTTYLSDYYERDFTKVFIPHGGVQGTSITTIENRKYELVFAGTYTDPDSIRSQWLSYDPHLSKLLDDIAESALFNSSKTLFDIVKQQLVVRGLGDNRSFLRKLDETLIQVDHYIRQRRRQAFLSAMHELPVHIFGTGWEKLAVPNRTNLTLHEPVSFSELQSIMNRTKIVLNIMPNFTHGGHERIFTSMLCGAVSMTDSNTYLQQTFIPNKNILFFELERMHEAPGQVEALLKEPAELELIAQNGKHLADTQHRWLHRAAQIAEAAKFHYTFYSAE